MSHRPEVKLGVPPIPAIKRPHLDLTPGPLHSLGSPTAPSVGGGGWGTGHRGTQLPPLSAAADLGAPLMAAAAFPTEARATLPPPAPHAPGAARPAP